MPETPMTLIERLTNPQWRKTDFGLALDIDRTVADMAEAAHKLRQAGDDDWDGCTHLDCLPGCRHSLDAPHCERFAQWQREHGSKS